MSKKLLSIILSLVVVIVFSGCSSKSADNSAATATPDSTNTEVKATDSPSVENVTIRFSTWDDGHDALVKKFQELHPNIKVEYEKVAGDYDTKLLTQIAAGEAPDVFEVGNPTVYANTKVAENLTPLMKNDNINSSDYYPSVLKMGEFQGNLYALPKDYSDFAVFYNKKLFDDAKISYPKEDWTWEEFKDTARKLTKKENGKTTQWGASVGAEWDMPFEAMVQQAGGQLSDPTGQKTVGFMNGSVVADTLDWFLNFFSDGLAPTPTQRTAMKGVDLFASQKVAMAMTGTWFIQNWAKTPGLDYAAVGLPKNKQRSNFVAWAGFSLNSKSKHKKEAWELLKYIGGYEGSMAYGKYALPSMPKAAEDLKLTADPIENVFLTELAQVHELSFQRNAYWGESGSKMVSEMLSTMIGKAEKGAVPRDQIQKALDDAAKKSQQVIDEKSK